VKKDLFGIARINLAAFWNTIDNVQREIQIPVVGVGTAQIITNSADARIRGLEGELTLKPGAGFTLAGQFGYTQGKYTDVFYDLNNDGVINDTDYNLKLPRLSPWSYGGSIAWTGNFGDFGLDARVAANYRDADWYNDANTGLMRAATMLDANIAVRYDNYTISFYGTNLLNEATFGAEAPLAFFKGSTFSPLNKGRVYGVEVSAKF
jgi:iron complex outermembrane receptor protein